MYQAELTQSLAYQLGRADALLESTGDAVKKYDARQPRDDIGQWTSGGSPNKFGISAGHAVAVMKHEGISDTAKHEEVRKAVESGQHKTREDVLKHIDSIHAGASTPTPEKQGAGAPPQAILERATAAKPSGVFHIEWGKHTGIVEKKPGGEVLWHGDIGDKEVSRLQQSHSLNPSAANSGSALTVPVVDVHSPKPARVGESVSFRLGGSGEMASGKRVAIHGFENHEFVVHKIGGEHRVSELSTGGMVAGSLTSYPGKDKKLRDEKAAIAAATHALRGIGDERFQSIISRAKAKSRKSLFDEADFPDEYKAETEAIMEDTLIHYGGEIKSVEETDTGYKFGGWLVVFDKPDVSSLRDRFTKSTDFDIEDGDRRSIYYNHGLDGTIKKEKLGDCHLTVKDAGVWIQGEIKKRDDYLAKHAQHIAENIKQFGLSSGAPAHLVERVKVAGGHEVKKWVLSEASITPTPAEPMTGCYSLKSLLAIEADEYELKAKNGDWITINSAHVQVGSKQHAAIINKITHTDDTPDKSKDKSPKASKDDVEKAAKKHGLNDKQTEKLKAMHGSGKVHSMADVLHATAELLKEHAQAAREGFAAGRALGEAAGGKSLEADEYEEMEIKYSADQARDDDGKFGSGGGGESSGGGNGSPHAALSAAATAISGFGHSVGNMQTKKAYIAALLDEAAKHFGDGHPAKKEIEEAKAKLAKAKTFPQLGVVAGHVAVASHHAGIEKKSEDEAAGGKSLELDGYKEVEIKKYDPDQARGDDGKWSIIRGKSVKHTGAKVKESHIHEIADDLELSGNARNALLKAHRDGKIKTDEHLYRTIAASQDALDTSHGSQHHGIVKAAAEMHGVGGSHEGKPWHAGGNAKPGPSRKSDDDGTDFPDEFKTESISELESTLPDGLDFSSHSLKVLAANGELLERIESLADMRCVKSNRRWSVDRHEMLMGIATELNQCGESIKALADAHAPRSVTGDLEKSCLDALLLEAQCVLDDSAFAVD